MNRIFAILTFLLATVSAEAAVVTGRVSCDGSPVAGVSVSDGEKVVLTDAKGCYKIKSDVLLGYVFISVPSGYEVPSKGIMPQFFVRIASGCKSARADFELVRASQEKYNLVVFNDIHLVGDKKEQDLQQAHAGFFPDVKAVAESLEGPVYGLTLGDMTSDSKWYSHNYALPEYLEEVADLPFPVWHAMGNHDNDMRAGGGDFNSSSTFRKVIGPNYYSFNLGRFHIVVLDNIYYDNPYDEKGIVKSARGYHTHLDDMQFAWLRNDLKYVQETTPVILVAHAPFSRLLGVEDGKDKFKDGFTGGYYGSDVLYMFRKFPSVHILSGHTHENYFVQISPDVLEHNNIAVSGASWKLHSLCGLNLIRDGVPGGYSVYTIDGDSLSWYYKASGHAMEDCQFRAYDMNVVPEAFREGAPENSIWINVFNYDPQWKVSVREDGRELEVRREFLKDPLYNAAVHDTKLGKGTYKVKPNNHMFTARASKGDSKIDIVVTDRFGRTFTQTMERPGYFGVDMNIGNR